MWEEKVSQSMEQLMQSIAYGIVHPLQSIAVILRCSADIIQGFVALIKALLAIKERPAEASPAEASEFSLPSYFYGCHFLYLSWDFF